ncbi:phage tail fiber protein [Proteus terrae]|uniref:phage tail fiber protein n=1 Tax=Proteus terrae TaxID=1574161 RepID=UPI00384EEAEF
MSGSAIVKGTGTKFKNNNPAINIGMTILIKSGNTNIPYMIKSVNSDTELVLAQPALATATNTVFSIHITEPDNNSDAARTMVAINSYVEYFLDAMNTWMTQTGQTKIEMPNGEVVTLDSIKKMQGDISNKADLTLSKTQSFTSAIEATTKLTSKSADGKTSISLTTSNAGGTNIELNSVSGYNGIQIPKKTGTLLVAEPQYIIHKSINDWAGIRLYKANGEYGYIETNTRDNEIFTIGYRNSSDINQAVLAVPKKSGTLMLVGDYGIGNREPTLADALEPTKTIDKTQLIRSYGGGNLRWGVGMLGFYAGATHWGAFTFNDFTFNVHWDMNGTVSQYYAWTSKNTTTDPQGFIKKASPIIDIYPDGTFTTNDESEGATVTRVAQGEYLIEGVLGFNSDAGWGGVDGGIEIPLDVNKQPLIWVNSKVNKDGSILVKTYHRTHPNAPEFANNKIDGYKNGDPIDIPDGRFISVRVQMPEQSIYNVRMREMEEAQKAEEERRQKEEEMKAQFGLGENDALL